MNPTATSARTDPIGQTDAGDPAPRLEVWRSVTESETSRNGFECRPHRSYDESLVGLHLDGTHIAVVTPDHTAQIVALG